MSMRIVRDDLGDVWLLLSLYVRLWLHPVLYHSPLVRVGTRTPTTQVGPFAQPIDQS